MVAATVTSMGVIGGRYGLVSVQVEDFLRTFANSIFNNLLHHRIHRVANIIMLLSIRSSTNIPVTNRHVVFHRGAAVFWQQKPLEIAR